MSKPIATNKKAFRDYAFHETYECGIALSGGEVKSIRLGNVSFADSFARIDKNEVKLYNLHIEPYAQASYLNEDPDRIRKLLMHKKEIKKLIGKVAQQGYVLIPTKLYFNSRGFAKIELALGKSKKQYDKREDIKKRDINRDISRAIRNKQKR